MIIKYIVFVLIFIISINYTYNNEIDYNENISNIDYNKRFFERLEQHGINTKSTTVISELKTLKEGIEAKYLILQKIEKQGNWEEKVKFIEDNCANVLILLSSLFKVQYIIMQQLIVGMMESLCIKARNRSQGLFLSVLEIFKTIGLVDKTDSNNYWDKISYYEDYDCFDHIHKKIEAMMNLPNFFISSADKLKNCEKTLCLEVIGLLILYSMQLLSYGNLYSICFFFHISSFHFHEQANSLLSDIKSNSKFIEIRSAIPEIFQKLQYRQLPCELEQCIEPVKFFIKSQDAFLEEVKGVFPEDYITHVMLFISRQFIGTENFPQKGSMLFKFIKYDVKNSSECLKKLEEFIDDKKKRSNEEYPKKVELASKKPLNKVPGGASNMENLYSSTAPHEIGGKREGSKKRKKKKIHFG